MERHEEAPAVTKEGAPPPEVVEERAKEYESFEEAERRRLESYARQTTARERDERFPLG